MTQYYLLNRVTIGNTVLKPGTLVDTAAGDNVTAIKAAGGGLIPAGLGAASGAGAIVQAAVKSGLLPEFAGNMMVALAAAALASSPGTFALSLNDLRIVDANNNVGATAANGGLLASDTSPPLAATSKAERITWATGSVVPLSFQTSVPKDLDPTQPLTLELVAASGTTDAASIGVQAIWDANAAVSYTTDDSASKSATLHTITATLLAADIPAAPVNLGVILTPPAHATNTIILAGLRLSYSRALAAA